MRKFMLFALVLLVSVTLFGCAKAVKSQPPKTDEINRKAVESLVENFGKKLQMVSLLAPADVVTKSMQENYGDLASPELLAKWQSDPQNAPGRMVSSPWPDRIEIIDAKKISKDTYEVKGQIIEITSVEQASGEAAAKRPITLIVKKKENRWVIDDVTLGAYETGNNAIIYKNSQYGFTFSLPKSWKGYTIVSGKWEGRAFDGPKNGEVIQTNSIISIRHPKWTEKEPRQDIPIMVFTRTQWEALQKGEFSVSAAPILPSELGRNSQYIFALPARYNYTFPAGFEEVERILENDPLLPNEEIK